MTGPLRKPVVSFTVPTTPVFDSAGRLDWTWLKWFQNVAQVINSAFDQAGNFDGALGIDCFLVSRNTTTLTLMLQNLSDLGVVEAAGVDFAIAYANKDTDHIADGTGFPLAGGKAAYIAFIGTSPSAGQILVFDGVNWLPHAKATTFLPLLHEWIKGYDDATGLFTASRPDYNDLTGAPIPPSDAPATANQFLNSYTASTGIFTEAQPAFSNLSGTIATATQMPASGVAAGSYTNASLTVDAEGLVTAASSGPAGISAVIVTAALTTLGTQGSLTYVDGILTAQVPAT